MCEITNTDLGQIEYSIRGKGIPVVFFHGGHSNCKETLFQKGWDLSKYMIITPSRPGYGNTPLNVNSTPRKTAEITKDLLDKLEINKAIVVGISAGGHSAIAFAEQYPEKTCNLILISAVTKKWLNENDDLYKRGMKMFSPKMEKFSWMLFRLFFRIFPKRMSKTLFDELSSKPNQEITKSEMKQIKEMTFKQASGSGFVNDLNQDIEHGVIQKVKCKTLVLHSENDKSVPIEMAFYADKEIKHSILKTFDNKWGHLLWVGEDSKYPIEELNEFLNKNACC